VGNIYVNRNQIGAVVGSQPFGGEGLSGTGPKAGGPEYLTRFTRRAAPAAAADSREIPEAEVAAALRLTLPPETAEARVLPGPTGESNRLTVLPRLPILCLGPSAEAALAQAEAVRALGGRAVEAPGLAPLALARLEGFGGALWWGDEAGARAHARALAGRKGPILPLIADLPDAGHVLLERHVCIDTTASGGNAQLLAEVGAA
jgi:RHH-type proline utilization regulon transcriptional repressor/proline dehydrogenase/delta 1-pyrroline-5-carboxylate dehydrogenase